MPITFSEALAQAQGQGGGLAPSEPTVYLGQGGRYVGSTFEKYDKNVGVSEGIADFNNWSDEERWSWGKRLYGAGLLNSATDWSGMVGMWKYAVEQTAGLNAGQDPSKKKLTPWGFISMLEARGAGDDALADRQKALQPRTSTSTSYNAIPTKADAHTAIKTLFREQLGRDPEDGELDRYTSMMLSKMKANPGKTVSTSVSDPRTGNTTSTSRSYAGYDPSADLEGGVKDDPEWGAYQAATTYFNALQGAIGAPGGA